MEQRAGLEDLCKRRFFYRQGSEIYGGVAGFGKLLNDSNLSTKSSCVFLKYNLMQFHFVKY